MKKQILVLGLFFLTNSLFARNWLAGADLLFTFDRTHPDSYEAPDYTRLSLDVYAGRYFFENVALGAEFGYYCLNLTKNSFRIGPFIEYDFLRLQYLSLGLKSSLSYHKYFKSIMDKYSGYSIDFASDLLINFLITKNIEIFTSLAGVQFKYLWWDDTVSGTKTKYSRTLFDIDGLTVLNNLKIGLKFKF